MDGDLDPSFGSNSGLELVTITGSDIRINALTSQPDDAIVSAGQVGGFALVPADVLLARFDADGHPDPAFGSNGLVVTDLGDDDVANAVVIQPDGRIVTAGRSTTIGNPPFGPLVLIRYLRDGSLDPAFGQGGLVRADPSPQGGFTEATCLALDLVRDRLIVGGYTSTPGASTTFMLAAFARQDGAIDPTFGRAGFALQSPTLNARINDLAISNDNHILVAGAAIDPPSPFSPPGTTGKSFFALGSYDLDGSLDIAFGGSGFIKLDLGTNAGSDAKSIVAQPDGKLTATGSAVLAPDNTASSRSVVVRLLLPSGTLDPTFGSIGRPPIKSTGVFFPFWPDTFDIGNALAIDSIGRVAVAGIARVPNFVTTEFHPLEQEVYRSTSNGEFDSAFAASQGGNVLNDVGGATSSQNLAILIQANDKILTAGTRDATGDDEGTLVRYL